MRVAINGFGRIGRGVFKIALENKVDIIAINDLTDTKTLAYLLQYDSIYGPYKANIKSGKDFLIVNGKKVKVLSEKDPASLPWKKLKIGVVVESTGSFTDRENASKHLDAGAKKVLISAPAKNTDITIVLGVNEKSLSNKHKIISMGSCTTNCLAPIAKVLNDGFGIKKGFMTSIHAYTPDQRLHDAPHKKLRRGRAAAFSIVPTTSGATQSVIEVLPELKGKLNGLAMRVPVICGSIVDFVAELNKSITAEKINNAFKNVAKGKLKRILQYTEEEMVSADIIGNSHSAVIDGLSTQVLGNNLIKVLGWYDNEYAYSYRMVDVLKLLAKK